MYKCGSIYGNDPKMVNETLETEKPIEDLAEFSKLQQSQLRRLTRLQEKLNQLCEDLNLSHLSHQTTTPNLTRASPQTVQLKSARISTKVNKTSHVEDLVIHVSCKTVPYAVLAAFHQLSSKFKCFLQFFIHGTALKEFAAANSQNESHVRSVIDLFNKLGFNLVDSRNSYDYAVTLIWKKMESEALGPVLNLNSTTKIYGESNIVRFLNRLTGCESNSQSDNWMDKCTNCLLLSRSNTASYLTALNKFLESAKFLSSNSQPDVADYYNWSIIKQLKCNLNNLSNLSEWVRRIEGQLPLIQSINSL